MNTLLTLLPAVLFATVAAAQRPTPTFEWQKRSTTIEYGAVPVGKHSLAELPVGQTWRMGMNEASSWQLTMPVLAGEQLLAPGAYRVQLQRSGESSCDLLANGSGKALGGGADGKVGGKLGKASKPAKKLDLAWAKGGAAVAGNQPAKLVLQFGDVEWQGEVTIVGNKPLTVPGWKLAVFTLPAALLAARDKTAVPVAVLSRGKDKDQENWNLVVGKDDAKLVPWMTKPTQNNGFGDIVAPDEKLTTTGKVESVEIKVPNELATAEPATATLVKGELVLEIGFAKEAIRITVPEPKGKGGK